MIGTQSPLPSGRNTLVRIVSKTDWNRALLLFTAASLAVTAGVAVAASRFPGGFDWVYTVISRLGSQRHNPDGAVWLSLSLLVAVCLLWPVAGLLGRGAASGGPRPRRSIVALRIGLAGAALLALEGLLTLDLSRIARKGHEAVALATFLGMYGGVLGLYLHRLRRSGSFLWPALLVVLPICAVGISQVVLYLDQRDLGWVDTAWREMGIPFWLSFAFWQWLAVGFLGIGLGVLVVCALRSGSGRGDARLNRDPGPPCAGGVIIDAKGSRIDARCGREASRPLLNRGALP
jgi:hypothetical protein